MIGWNRDRRMGDPDGRRIARRRAERLSEAARVAASLRVLVDRAGAGDEVDIGALERRLIRLEEAELHRAYGRIEGRSRFRRRVGSGNPIREDRALNLLYLDESGTSHPAVKPGSQEFFALAAIAMSSDAERAYIEAADQLKRDFFGHAELTFHEPHIRQGDGRFSLGGLRERQNEFRARLGALVSAQAFTVFAVAIRKRAYEQEFIEQNLDPYLPHDAYALALHLLLERYLDFLAHHPDHPRGRLTLEAQGPKEDAEHQRAYVETLLEGTQWVSGSDFQKYLETGLRYEPKSGSRPTELADLVARDVFEWVRSGCTTIPTTWWSWGSKIYGRGDLRTGKYGLKVFPDSDIRGLIEAQRAQFRERD